MDTSRHNTLLEDGDWVGNTKVSSTELHSNSFSFDISQARIYKYSIQIIATDTMPGGIEFPLTDKEKKELMRHCFEEVDISILDEHIIWQPGQVDHIFSPHPIECVEGRSFKVTLVRSGV